MMVKKINIGCGEDYRPGWINLDMHNKDNADVIFDLRNIFDGKKLPFKDNEFDYVYCSHVLEDFIEPMTIINELIRICKVGGLIELRTPFETNNNLTNIYHKSSFTLSKFASLTMSDYAKNYGDRYCLKIKELNYYVDNNKYKIFAWCYNLISYKLIERTFIKYLLCILNCRVVYEKIEGVELE